MTVDKLAKLSPKNQTKMPDRISDKFHRKKLLESGAALLESDNVWLGLFTSPKRALERSAEFVRIKVIVWFSNPFTLRLSNLSRKCERLNIHLHVFAKPQLQC